MKRFGKKHRSIRGMVGAVAGLLMVSLVLGGCSDEDVDRILEADSEEAASDAATDGNGDGAAAGDVAKMPKPEGTADWTVLLYLCGSDLESNSDYMCASYNLAELMDASFGDNVNVVVETGGSEKWHTDGVSADEQARFQIRDGEMNKLWSHDVENMGDPNTLQDFITWGADHFPAERYALVMWDHGGGSLYGVCSDEHYEGDTLSLPEVTKALDGGDVSFDLVGFDACLMASLETAEAVSGHAKYMVASEETEPGYGWDYTALAEYLDENPDADGGELGKNIADSYYEKCASYDTEDTATLSVTDLSKLPAVSEAFQVYTTGLLSSSEDAGSLRNLQQGADSAEQYGVKGSASPEDGFNMVDLDDLMDNTKDVLGSETSDVKKALSEAVAYEVHGDARSEAGGLSVFYPLYADDDVVSAYSKISNNAAYLEYTSILSGKDYESGQWDDLWSEWISEIMGEAEETEDTDSEESSGLLEHVMDSYDSLSELTPVSENDTDISYKQYLDSDNVLHLDITGGNDYVRSVWFDLYYEDEESGQFVYLGSDSNINGDYSTGKFYDNFYGDWITIGGEYVNAQIIEEGDNYSLYTIPILLNGEETNLRAMYDSDKEEYRILGTYDGAEEDTGMSSRDNLKKLKEGDQIDFLFNTFTAGGDDDDIETVTLGSITWSDDTEMTDESLGDGKFLYMFDIYDTFGNEISTDPYVMQTEGEDIYVEPWEG